MTPLPPSPTTLPEPSGRYSPQRMTRVSLSERRVGKEFPGTRQNVRKIEFIKEKGRCRTAGRLPGSQGKSTVSMGCWSVFIAREPASHLLTGQSMYTFSVLSGRKTRQMSFLIWDGKGTGHAAWGGSGTLQCSHCDRVIGVL